MSEVIENFIRYVKIDTQSDESSVVCPSTAKQFDLGRLLVEELQQLGLSDAAIDENGYVMATIPANCEKEIPVIGFIAHMDTAPDMSGKDVKPRFVENYDGKDIILNEAENIILSPSDFPEMQNYKGQTLIVTDGKTLLGADDKAGIAEIMTAVKYLLEHPEIEHGDIKIGFTPDEEIGRGADKFDVEKFGAQYAYTVDGGELGELEYENFNAAGVKIRIFGRNVHPGSAKNKMINSMLIGMELNSMLPANESPEYTEGYEGFFHLTHFRGAVEESEMGYIIRDHDFDKFQDKKQLMTKVAEFLNEKYGKGVVECKIKDQYFNMKEKIVPVKHIVDLAEKAMEMAGVEPLISPVRGGTDGARLSYMGLPTPNIFTGGHNYHGKYEYVAVESMEKAVEVILNIVKLFSEK